MMYKMEQGRLMEYHASINSTNATVLHEESKPYGALTVVDTSESILFRFKLFTKPVTIVANDTFETVEAVQFLRTLGYLQ